MIRSRKTTAVIAALMTVVTLFGFGVSAFAASSPVEADNRYDYSHVGSESNIVLSSPELLAAYLGDELGEKEKAFLESFTSIELVYNDIITTDKVTVTEITGGIKLSAAEYSYTAANGKKFVWVPVTAELDSVSKPLVNGECTFEVADADSAAVTVRYEATAEISVEDMNSVVNLYFDTCDYAKSMDDYSKKLKLYNEYVVAKRIYDDALVKYNKYLGEYAEYEKDLAEYNGYEAKLAEYNTAYNLYLEYLKADAAYDGDLVKYQAYIAEMEKVRKQLSAIELVKVKMTDDRTIFAAVNGGTVDQVLDSVGEIVTKLGVDRAVVNNARVATNKVRELMNTYYSYETERERYSYYAQNYSDFCTYFLQLTQCLDKLYENSMVRMAMGFFSNGEDDKKRKYIILVAQLALVSNALIDGELKNYGNKKIAYNSTWKIDGKTITQILENKEYFNDDNTSTPLATGYPSEMNEPVKPTEVKEPTFPVKPALPVAPVEIASPGTEPVAVEEPVLPTTANAYAKEIYDGSDDAERAEFISASATARTLVAEPYIHKLHTSVVKTVGIEQVLVSFVSESGEPLYDVTIDSGTRVLYDGVMPDDYYESAEGEFKLSGWQVRGQRIAEAERFDLSKPITESVVLEPRYERQPAYYNVTWVINGKEYTDRLISGEVPVCPYKTEKPETLSKYYVFTGWNKPVTELLEDVRYEAVFAENYILTYDGDNGAIITDDGSTVICDLSESGYSSVKADLSGILARIAGTRALVINTRFGSLSFNFADVIAMHGAGVDELWLSCSTNGSTLYKYTSSLKTADGSICETLVSPDVVLPARLNNPASAVFSENGSTSQIRHTLNENSISFSMTLGKSYTLKQVQHIYTVESELATVTLSSDTAEPGERIQITVTLKEGVELERLIVTDMNGNELKVSSKGSFTVGDSDVRVAVQAKYITHTITFVADGKTVSRLELMHGDKITIPADPKKGNDEKYSYTFKGWSPSVPEFATGDATFEAEFDKEELPEDLQGGIEEPDEVEKKDDPVKNVAIAAAAIAIAMFLIIVVLIIRARRF
ncbi:MAG: hypothetical protein E7617_06145 [Ruminococcaceae bacterium]|nr:hypothetical protein [Oscillospiraceae bacterium]